MIILLYGKDTYRSKKKLEEIISSYKEKNKSGLNIKVLEEDENFLDFCDYDRQVSMFDEKRFVVAKNILDSEDVKKNFVKKRKTLQESDNIFLFYEEKEIKKQDKVLKALLKEEKGIMIQEFEVLDGKNLVTWIKREFALNETDIEDGALTRISSIGGGDLWRLKAEIDKLCLYKKKITKEDVDYMTNLSVEANIFQTIDAMAERDIKKALKLLYDHMEKGDNIFYLLSMIVYQFRNLIVVSDLIERGVSYEEARNKSGLHSFVFSKCYKQAKKFSLEELKSLYNSLFKIDLQAKTGQVSPEMAIQIFLFRL